jgi:Asp-tRNA(Asn)/Glu-tRNA(Gln) amidotransferase A subunit family amidase
VHSIDERLERIERHADLGAFWRVGVQEPTSDGPLSGRLVGFKDCFAVAGFERDSGVPFLHEHTTADAPSVRRHREAGATIVGKLSMHQLAWGMMGQTPGRPPVRNPHDPTRIPGGSSSGSAVALAAGLVDLAPGTDTGGSVRMPASACGIVGLKPTFGLVDKAGIHPNTLTLDHCGPMARTVGECALGLDVLVGREPRALEPARLAGLRVGVLETWFCEELDPGVERAFRAAVDALGRAGAVLAPADIGWQHDPNVLRDIYNCEPLPCYGDGVAADPAPYEPFIVQDVRDGFATPLTQYLETLYRLDEARRRAAADEATWDVLISPTVPIPPPPIDSPDLTYSMNRNTKPFNGLGWPALSLPCGVDDLGLPVGLQVAGHRHEDDRVLAVAAAIEGVLQ